MQDLGKRWKKGGIWDFILKNAGSGPPSPFIPHMHLDNPIALYMYKSWVYVALWENIMHQSIPAAPIFSVSVFSFFPSLTNEPICLFFK